MFASIRQPLRRRAARGGATLRRRLEAQARRTGARLCLVLSLLASAHAAPDPSALAAARALFDSGQGREAQQAFVQLAAADPGDPDLNYYLGQLANRRNEPEQAVTFFERALAAEPQAGRHHHGLGDAFGRTAQKAGLFSKFGWAKKCVAAYERAVELDPGNVEFRLSLFEYYRQAPGIVGGGYDKAVAQAAAITQIDRTRGRVAYAILYTGEKKYDQALAELDQVLAAAPSDYVALYEVGRLAAVSGRFVDRGLGALRRCLELPAPTAPQLPSHAAVQWRLGQLLEKKSDLPRARAAYAAAVNLDPSFAPAAEALQKLR